MESFPKRRGRPQSVYGSENVKSQFAGIYGNVSDRTLRNRHWFQIAAVALQSRKDVWPKKYRHIWDTSKHMARYCILTELGRFEDPRMIRELAERICREKWPTREAVAWLRKIRGTSKPAIVSELLTTLAKAVDSWMNREGATREGAIDALRTTLTIVEENDA